MARKPLRPTGRRAAPSTGGAQSPSAPRLSGVAGKTPEVLPPDSYDVAVKGARLVPYRSGALSVELTLETLGESEPRLVDLDNLLVLSQGGPSNYTRRNVGMLTDLAGIQEGEPYDETILKERLNTGHIRAEVSLYVGTDMGGRTVNKLGSVDALITDEED
jgi:hypothetical protein